jgi:group I intron endonuclease
MAYGYIYLVSHPATGKSYIGLTTYPISERWKLHCRAAVCGRQSRGILHQAIRLYGREAFTITQLAQAETKQALDRLEVHFIRLFNTKEPFGYNRMSGGANGKHNPRTRLKMSAAKSGRKLSPDQIEKIRARMMGNVISQEVREKIASKLRGRRIPRDIVERVSAGRRGKKRSDAHRMSAYLSGIPKSDEHKAKLRAANLGKRASIETRMKMSASHKRRAAERRNAGDCLQPPLVLSQAA